MTDGKYYNHDAIWRKRVEQNHAVWGRHSLRVYAEVLALVARFRPRASTLLDVGCGAGAFGSLAAAKGLVYTGVDDSQVGIDLGLQAHQGVRLQCVDMAKPLDSDLGLFDVVTAINSLHCLIDPQDRQTFLNNMVACASADGIVIVTTMCGPVSLEKEPVPARAYLSPVTIKSELHQVGLNTLLFELFEPASEHAKIPNLTLVARR